MTFFAFSARRDICRFEETLMLQGFRGTTAVVILLGPGPTAMELSTSATGQDAPRQGLRDVRADELQTIESEQIAIAQYHGGNRR